MGDPRLDGCHLNTVRRGRYAAAVDELLDARGLTTAAADPLLRPPSFPRPTVRREPPPPGGTYTLVSLTSGRRHQLRVGVNTLGRYQTNDLVLGPVYVSRRHCAVLVHAAGGCEVHDTASRNGTRVNRRRVDRADLLPGDVLELCDQRFL